MDEETDSNEDSKLKRSVSNSNSDTPSSNESMSSVDSNGSYIEMEETGVQQQETTIRRKKKKIKLNLSPSNSFSQFFFLWIFKIVKICYSIPDIRSINFILAASESAKETGDKLEKEWNNRNPEKPSLFWALFRAFGKSFVPLGIWKLLWASFTWIGTYFCFRMLLVYKESLKTDKPEPALYGHLYAGGIFLCSFFGSLCFHHLTSQATRIGIQCRAALMVLIYRKSLKLSYVKGGVGDIVNLISVECNRIAEAIVHLHYLWSAAVECLLLLGLAYTDIGYSAFAPFTLVILLLFPLQFVLAVNASSAACIVTGLITKRVHLMSEILTAIKLIKFFTWEDYYRGKVKSMRKLEMDQSKRELIFKIASFAIVFTTPAILICVSISVYHYLGNILTPSIAFSLLFLLNTLRYPLLFLPNAERNINGAQQALTKLQDFFLLPEIDGPTETCSTLEPNILMKFESADFVWDGDLDHPHIINLSITLLRDQVIAIVGDVGSGKSLLAAIMGQLKRTNGTIKSNGAVCGYVPEEPWFINATLRDNIMFGLDPDEKRYSDAIRISGLTRDIMLLSNGDDTYINDLNLSPSQKQRISLARCIYLNPDIILMEDCLSDFDHTQSKQLFKECIKNQLSKNRCIIMLTQQKQFLSDFDHILVLKGGKVVEQGSYVDLKAKNVNFSAWVTDMVQLEDDPTGLFDNTTEIKLDPSTSTTSPTPISPLKPVSNNFCHLQIRKRTSKPRSSPLASAKPINANADTTNSTIRQLMELNSSSMQTSQLNEHTISKMIERSQNSILTGNSMRPPANFANQDVVSRTIEANHLTVHSLHDFDVGTLEPGNSDANSSPYIQFLREKPGLVLSVFFLAIFLLAHGFRFFSDVWLKHLVDELPNGFNVNLMVQWILTGIIAFSILIRGVGFSYMILRKAAVWHTKILESVLRAPMSFFDVTPLGHILSFFARHLYSIDETLPDTALQVLTFLPLVLGTIVMACAYIPWLWVTVPIYLVGWFLIIVACVSVQNLFLQLETNNKSPMFAHLSTTLEGLFSIRLYHAESRFDYFNRTLIDADHKALYSLLLVKTLTSVCLDSVSSFFIYVTALFCVLFPVSASDTGIAITNILQLLLFVPWLVKMFFEMHGSMTSVSSLIYFGDHVPRETRSKNVIVPPKEWPTDGQIVFKDVTSKYHRYGVSVLKGVTFHIEPREKIAILGRSGSGKSTILMSILRIIEPSEGHMFIDGVDLSSISLKSLRSRIAIIPQEPVMLTGTIRTNLDPFGISTDEEIWDALKMVHLADKIEEMPNKLETAIAENGRKFNIPERQLFCIARAVLIRTKIIIYDEPSVIVDRDTERLIQQVMTENFADCTVIVLATRFRVIVQMDRVMVMKHGQIVEFDTPLALLDNPKSKFSLMLSQTGDVDPNHLRQLALKKLARSSSKSLDSLEPKSSSRSNSVLPGNIPYHLGELFVQPTGSSPSSTKSDLYGSTIVLIDKSNNPGDE